MGKAVLLCVLLGGCATDCESVALPPTQYERQPSATPLVSAVPFHQVKVLCKSPAWGCYVAPNVIVVSKGGDDFVSNACEVRVTRHELGHMNGWEHE